VSNAIVEASEQDVTAALEQGFEDIFREHYQTVYRTAYGVLGNPHDAEDVAQTIFLRLVHRRSSRDVRTNPGAYLYRAAVNESLTLIRARRRHILTGDVERLEAPAAVAESAEEIHKRLYEAVAGLSRGAAEILILRYVHDKSDAAIAKLLGTSRGTIAVSLYRSRARLRKLMRASSAGGQS
jgi:RNA polymerase sigma-70 factor (ECF subfamily)